MEPENTLSVEMIEFKIHYATLHYDQNKLIESQKAFVALKVNKIMYINSRKN